MILSIVEHEEPRVRSLSNPRYYFFSRYTLHSFFRMNRYISILTIFFSATYYLYNYCAIICCVDAISEDKMSKDSQHTIIRHTLLSCGGILSVISIHVAWIASSFPATLVFVINKRISSRPRKVQREKGGSITIRQCYRIIYLSH